MEKLKKLGNNLNAYTFEFEDSLLDAIRESYHNDLKGYLLKSENQKIFEGGRVFRQKAGDYYLYSYDDYPLLWFSVNKQQKYDIYKAFFQSLNINNDLKQIIDYEKEIIMYSAFMVIGRQAPGTLWHYDFRKGANAYTLITPLFEPEKEHGNLLYELNSEEERIYHYKLNQAIVFGEGFLHSTEPYSYTDKIRVLLSLTFGTDKIKYWPIIKKNVKNQSKFYILPCGHLPGRCYCNLKSKIHTLFDF